MKKKLVVHSTQWPPKTKKEWKDFDKQMEQEALGIWRGIAQNFVGRALEFQKELDKLGKPNRVYGQSDIQALRRKFKKVLEVLE